MLSGTAPKVYGGDLLRVRPVNGATDGSDDVFYNIVLG